MLRNPDFTFWSCNFIDMNTTSTSAQSKHALNLLNSFLNTTPLQHKKGDIVLTVTVSSHTKDTDKDTDLTLQWERKSLPGNFLVLKLYLYVE